MELKWAVLWDRWWAALLGSSVELTAAHLETLKAGLWAVQLE